MAHVDLTDAELFDAAVSYSRRRGKLKAETDADPGKSRSTGQSFVLAAADDRVIDRIPLDKLYRDAEKMQDTHLPEVTKGWNDLPVAGKVAFILVPSMLLLNFCSSGGIQSSPPTQSSPPSDWIADGSAWASCEVALKNQLRDPDSYQQAREPFTLYGNAAVELAASAGITMPVMASDGKADSQAVFIWRFRSRNGFGGMNVADAVCVVSRPEQSVQVVAVR